VRNSELYGRRGVTYTERTTSNLSARVLNEGACFSGPGPSVIPRDESHLAFILAFMNSFAASYCIEAIIGGGDYSMKGTAARHLEPGYMKHLPVVPLSEASGQFFRAHMCRLLSILNEIAEEETDVLFQGPVVQMCSSLRQDLTAQTRRRFSLLVESYDIVAACENMIAELLAIPEERLRDAYSDSGWPWQGMEAETPGCSDATLLRLDPLSPHEAPAREGSPLEMYRFEMKQAHYLHAGVESHARTLGVGPGGVCRCLSQKAEPSQGALKRWTELLVSCACGCAFGRWDIVAATRCRAAPESFDPFASLPACPPGMLRNDEGLPVTSIDVPGDYPLRLFWPGIIVDDPGHPEDVERRIREVLEVIWKSRADAIEREACETLGVKSMRDYFRRPAGFFAEHLTRYSKSRRQAPIYWPLSTASGSYTLWVYYHRLTDQTLFTCVKDFVDPKLAGVTKDIARLRTELQKGGGGKQQQELETLVDLEQDLREFRDELLRLTKLPYKPDLNDGVMISACPLWKLFRLPKWQKDLKACWEALADGDYDWAHLAYAIWPDRVTEKCKTDRSLAIAHGLEHLCTVEPPKLKKGKKKGKKDSEAAEDTQMEVEL
jgi:hypothetical protein